jgi:hypothetical protein
MIEPDPREPRPDAGGPAPDAEPAPPPAAEPAPPPQASAYLPGNYQPNPPAVEERRPQGVRRLLIILASVLAGFVACAAVGLALLFFLTPSLRSRLAFMSPAAGAPPEAPDKFAPPPAGPVSISDDFSGNAHRWDSSQTQVAGGAYELTLDLDNFDSYGLYLGGSDITDFDMAVDATLVAGPPDAEYGVRFRQSAPDDHLIFSISPSGFYRLARVKDKQYTSLVPWTRDDRIRTGVGATNRLRVVAEGQKIVGYINDAEVLAYDDPAPQAGQLTLGLVTFAQGGLSVRFDNVAGFALAAPAGAEPIRLTLDENFADPSTAQWSVGGARLSAGAYEIFVGGPVVSWQQPLPSGSSTVTGDFTLEVEASMVSGNLDGPAGNSGYGVMFGDDGKFGFYSLLIVPQGGLALIRNGPDGGFVIPPIPVETVNPGLNAANKIRIEIRGNVMRLLVNDKPISVDGQEVAEIPLPEAFSADGMAGMIVQSNDADGVRARFDSFKLEQGS